jgi:uncharacterized membrane protein YeaQ/YmgE (transglycosylase-associated protein family)
MCGPEQISAGLRRYKSNAITVARVCVRVYPEPHGARTDLILGIVAGGLVGLIASFVFRSPDVVRRRRFVALGVIGGLLGVQLVSMFGGASAQDAAFDLHSLVVAAATAGVLLVLVHMFARRAA